MPLFYADSSSFVMVSQSADFCLCLVQGSHGRLYYGDRFTTVKDRKKEIGPGLLRKMLADLRLSPDDIEE
jgi:predicted RNA binding protein YcfA (HicA-like mRNA interferase family)